MQEYSSEALVLATSPSREADLRVSLFTQKFGKITARARSARKINSKLVAHLQPGFLTRVRIIEKNGFQVVDALRQKRLRLPLQVLSGCEEILGENDPEPELWDLLIKDGFDWKSALRILGWDPRSAQCVNCRENSPSHFNLRNQDFLCRNCVEQLRRNEVIYLY